mgnify:CR=1 FL=1
MALYYYEHARRLCRTVADIRRVVLVMGDLYEEMGRLERALSFYKLAADGGQEQPRGASGKVLLKIGAILSRMGRNDEAIEHYKRFI